MSEFSFEDLDLSRVHVEDVEAHLLGSTAASESALGDLPRPLAMPPPEEIPPRQWLYGGHLIRGYPSMSVAPGGLGKSSLIQVEALAMATGRPLLGEEPVEQLRVWYWNGEDPMQELERRFAAARLHYDLSPDDIGERLLVTSGREFPMTLVRQAASGVWAVNEEIVERLVTIIKTRQIDVFIIDPLITAHNVPENDNNAMNLVGGTLRYVADAADCAVGIVHHTTKAGSQNDEHGIYASRGGGALIDVARSARFLTRMSAKDAERWGIADRHAYFTVSDGKENLAPPSRRSWRRIVGVPLHNGRGPWPAGDNVGVCVAWTPSYTSEELPVHDLRRVQEAIDASAVPLARNKTSRSWVGAVIASAMGWDIGFGARKCERSVEQQKVYGRVERILQTCLRSGVLVERDMHSSRDGRSTKTVEVGTWVAEEDAG